MEVRIDNLERTAGTAAPPVNRETPRPTVRLGDYRTALGLFLLGTVTAALYAFWLYPRQGVIEAVVDLNGFGKIARHLAAGEGFSLDGHEPTLRRAPLYPAFLALMLRLFGSDGPDAIVYRPVIAIQCLMIGLCCVIAWKIGRALFDEKTGRLAGILCALTPQTLRYVGMAEVETPMTLFIALMALTGLNLYREPTLRNGLLFALVCAAATLTKPVAMLYLPVFAALCLWKWRKAENTGLPPEAGPVWRTLGLSVILFALCLLPWIVRNYLVSQGQFKSVSSNAPGEFLRGYVNAQPKYALLKQDFGGGDPSRLQWDMEANYYEDAILKPYGLSMFRYDANGTMLPAASSIAYELQKERIEGAEMRRRLLQEPMAFLKKFVTQLFTFWYIVETRKKSMLVGTIAAAALLLAGYGLIRARQNRIDTTPVVAVLLYFQVFYAAFLAFARYSMPLYPTLLTLSAYGLTQFGMRRGLKKE